MNNTLWIENLESAEDRRELARLFGRHGAVLEAAVIVDRDLLRRSGATGRVVMGSETAAAAAIEALDGFQYHGRQIRVRPARRSEMRPAGRRATVPIYNERTP